MGSDSLQFSPPGYTRLLVESISHLWKESSFCDVTLLIGRQKFSAHKIVLAAASPFFKAMFLSGMEEQRQDEIELHDIPCDIFKDIIHFIYTGAVTVSVENCQDLLSVADMLGVEDVVEVCGKFLLENISPVNCIGIFAFAEAHNLLHMKRQMEKYIERNFVLAVGADEFPQLELSSVLSILSSEKLHIDNESEVLEAVVKWVSFDLPCRRRSLLQLLNQVRKNLISQRHLFRVVDSCNDHGLKLLLTKWASPSRTLVSLNPHGLYSPVQTINEATWVRANAKKCIYVVGGFSRRKNRFLSSISTLDSVERFDVLEEKWELLHAMNHPRSSHAAAVHDRRLVVAGGEDASLISGSVESFDPDENIWTPMPSMNHPRYGLGLVSHNGSLYALGGYVGSEVGVTVEKFDFDERAWIEVDKMANPRFSSAVVQYEGLIYIVGGLSELYTETDMVESYNPVTREWCTLAKLKHPRAYHGLVAHEGYLYAVGGFNERTGSLDSVEKYSIKENKWTCVAPMSTSRAGAGVAVLFGKIYVFGGRSQEVDLTGDNSFCASLTLNCGECYDPRQDFWKALPEMTYERCETVAIVM